MGFSSLNWGDITKNELDQNIRALYEHKEADKLMELLRKQDSKGFKTKAQELQLTWWSEYVDKLDSFFYPAEWE